MATFTVQRPDIYPNTTVVKAYNYPGPSFTFAGAPPGSVIAEATVSSDKAELTGLTEGNTYLGYAQVGGVDRYLKIAPAVAAIAATSLAVPGPAVHGLLGWSFDPALASGTKILETAGTLHLAKVLLPEPCKITNIHMWMTTKGATLTALENGLGLFSEGRARLSQAAIAGLITQWEGATGEVKTALETPQNVPAGFVWVGAYYKGTTAPTFATAAPTIGVVNVNRTENLSRFATGDTGLTTALPNPITSPLAVSAQPFWVGVS